MRLPPLNQLLDRSESPVPLAMFRIALCLALLMELGQLSYFQALLFDDVPFLAPSRWPVGALIGLWAAAVACLLVGFKTRAAAVINYGCCVAVFGVFLRLMGRDWHTDGLFIWASLLLILLPAGATLSVDRWLAVRAGGPEAAAPRVTFLHTLFVPLTVGLLYLDSCFYKTASPMYMAGLGAWAPSTLPYAVFHLLPVLPDHETASRLIGAIVVAFEIGFLFLIWFAKLRLPLLATGLVLHLGIALIYPIPSFSVQMAALYLAMVPAGLYARLGGALTRRAPALAALTGGPATLPPRRDVKALLLVLIAGWFSMCGVLSLQSPTVRPHLVPENAWLVKAEVVSRNMLYLVFPWMGWNTHGVFMDSHWSGFTSQIALAVEADGRLEMLPMTSAAGTAGPYAFNRLWVHWTFWTANPRLPRAQREANLLRYATFWAIRHPEAWSGRPLVVLSRPVEVSLYDWQPGLLQRNLRQSWETIGRIGGRPGSFTIDWLEQPAPM